MKRRFERCKAKTGVCRTSIGSLVNRSLTKQFAELEKANFDGSILHSTFLIISLVNQLPLKNDFNQDDFESSDLKALLKDLKRNVEYLAPMSSSVSPSNKIELTQLEFNAYDTDTQGSQESENDEIDQHQDSCSNSQDSAHHSKGKSIKENSEKTSVSYDAIGALVQDSEGDVYLYFWILKDSASFDKNSHFSKLDGYWQKSDSDEQISDYEMQTLDTILVVYEKSN